MMKYYGFVNHAWNEQPIHIRIEVPTDIREDYEAIIIAYNPLLKGKNKLGGKMGETKCPIKYLPEWNTELQGFYLRPKDEKNLERITNRFLKELRKK